MNENIENAQREYREKYPVPSDNNNYGLKVEERQDKIKKMA